MPEEPKQSLEEQITDFLYKALRTGGFSVGGIVALVQLLKEDSDLAKAIASAVIGLMISYGATLLQPIHQGNKKRLEGMGKAAEQKIDIAGQAVVAKMLSMEDRYFEAQATVCELLKTEGVGKVSGLRNNLMLEKVFVPLELNLTMSAVGLRCDETLLEQPENITNREAYFTDDIWQILQKSQQNKLYRQIAVLAWGGYGKTTLLRHIAYRLGTNKQPNNVFRFIPVLLLLRQYRDLIITENSIDLPTVIEQHHLLNIQQSGKELRMPPNWAENQLIKGNILVMLDGFDEVPKEKRPLVAKWLNIQMQRYPKSVFILTSRPKAYTEQDQQNSLDLYSTFYIREFNEVQRYEFVKKWYWCQEYEDYGQDSAAIQLEAQKGTEGLIQQIEERKELRDLASNPLLLTMIARFHRRYPSAELPKRRAELYQEICTLQLKDRPNARELETLLVNCEAQVILQMLALEMMQRKLSGAEKSEG